MAWYTVCKCCKERYIGCHSKCEKYIKEVEYIKQLKEEDRKKHNIGFGGYRKYRKF